MDAGSDELSRYRGRVALVTGASSGIGAEIVRALTARGIRVAGCARSIEKLEELSQSLGEHMSSQFWPIECDLTEERQVETMFEHIVTEWGSLDILINSAGVAFNSSIIEGSMADWEQMLRLNVLTLCHCTQLAVRAMQRCQIADGAIINIGSEAGHMHPKAVKFHFYSATKHCVRALSETLRLEMKSVLPQARISCVSPGLVETPFLAKMSGQPELRLPVFDKMKSLQTGDVASAVVYILSTPAHVQIHDILLRPTDQKH